MESLRSTIIHTVELAVVFGIAFLILRYFQVDSDVSKYLVGIVLGALAKFARANESVPLRDYVNE